MFLTASLLVPPTAVLNYLRPDPSAPCAWEETATVCNLIESVGKSESRTNKYLWKTCAGDLDSGILFEKHADPGNLKLLKVTENTVAVSAARGEDLPIETFAAMSMYSLLPQLEGLCLSGGQVVDNVPSRRPRISRTLGLYPFSAEPPIAENIHKPNVRTKNKNKTQHLTRAHLTSTPGGRLRSSLLQVVKAVIKHLFHLFGTTPINRTSKGAGFKPWVSSKYLITHPEDKILQHNMDFDPEWLTDMDQDFLSVFFNSSEPVISTGDFPVANADSMQSINNVPPYAKGETSEYETDIPYQPLHLDSYSTNTLHMSPTSFQQAILDPSIFYVEETSQAFDGHDTEYFTPQQEEPSSDREWLQQFTTISPTLSPAPAPRLEDDMDNSICSVSDGVSPQSERLSTPIITPDCSPLSFPSASVESRSDPHRFKCPECRSPRGFRRRCDLHKHLKTHSKHLSCEYATQGCLKKFSTSKDMKRHADSVHRGKKDHRCELCIQQGADGMFSRKDNLRDHQKRVHGVESI